MTTDPEQAGPRPVDDYVATEELLRRNPARPIATVDDLAADDDPFESDDEHDEFLADLYASRQAAPR